MTPRQSALTRAQLADALTASRFVLALALVPVVAAGAWLAASIIVAAAWWTDFLDGRIARSTKGSRLGSWDAHADTAIGLGVVLGLAWGGHVPGPLWWLAVAGFLTAVYLTTRIFAISEVIQAVGYGPLLWLTATRATGGFVVLVATIGAILILDYRRFTSFTLPAFFRGIRAVAAMTTKRD